MTIKQKIKKTLIGATMIASLLCGNPSEAKPTGSAELMVGNTNNTLDLKLSSELTSKIILFSRNRISLDHENQVTYFGLIDLSHNIVGGLDALIELQASAPGKGILPRFGIQYFQRINDFSLYGMTSVSLQENPDAEISIVLGYNPQLKDEVALTFNVENFTNFGEEGHNYSLQRLRAGLKIKRFSFGPALDLNESADKITYNVGGFLKIDLE